MKVSASTILEAPTGILRTLARFSELLEPEADPEEEDFEEDELEDGVQ